MVERLRRALPVGRRRGKEQGTLVKIVRGVAASVGTNSGFLVNPRTRRQTPLRQAICAERKPQAGCPPIRESHVSGAPGRHNARQPGPACDAVPPHNAREKSGRHAKFPPKSMVRCLRLHPSFALNVLTQQIRKSPAGGLTPIPGPAESGCGEDRRIISCSKIARRPACEFVFCSRSNGLAGGRAEQVGRIDRPTAGVRGRKADIRAGAQRRQHDLPAFLGPVGFHHRIGAVPAQETARRTGVL
jgi:hypothetical protein